MTVEALRGYLAKLKPDGVLILHLSNRNLELRDIAQAVALEAGGAALIQRHHPPEGVSVLWESDEDVMIVGHSMQALAPYAADPSWRVARRGETRAWTDDYTNVFGALARQMRERWATVSQ